MKCFDTSDFLQRKQLPKLLLPPLYLQYCRVIYWLHFVIWFLLNKSFCPFFFFLKILLYVLPLLREDQFLFMWVKIWLMLVFWCSSHVSHTTKSIRCTLCLLGKDWYHTYWRHDQNTSRILLLYFFLIAESWIFAIRSYSWMCHASLFHCARDLLKICSKLPS